MTDLYFYCTIDNRYSSGFVSESFNGYIANDMSRLSILIMSFNLLNGSIPS